MCDQSNRVDEASRTHDASQFATDFVVGNLRNDDVNSTCQQTIKPDTALIAEEGSTAPTGVTKRARIEQYELPHDSVTSLEDWPVRTELVDRPHPLLIRGIVGAVRNLSDLPESRRADSSRSRRSSSLSSLSLPSGPKPEGGIGPIFLSGCFAMISMIAKIN